MYNPRILIHLLPQQSSILNIKIESQTPTVAHQFVTEGGIINGADGLVVLVGEMTTYEVVVQTTVVASRTIQLRVKGSMPGPYLTLLSVIFSIASSIGPMAIFCRSDASTPNNLVVQCHSISETTCDAYFWSAQQWTTHLSSKRFLVFSIPSICRSSNYLTSSIQYYETSRFGKHKLVHGH